MASCIYISLRASLCALLPGMDGSDVSPGLYTNMDEFQTWSTGFRTVQHQYTELFPYQRVLQDLRVTGESPECRVNRVRNALPKRHAKLRDQPARTVYVACLGQSERAFKQLAGLVLPINESEVDRQRLYELAPLEPVRLRRDERNEALVQQPGCSNFAQCELAECHTRERTGLDFRLPDPVR